MLLARELPQHHGVTLLPPKVIFQKIPRKKLPHIDKILQKGLSSVYPFRNIVKIKRIYENWFNLWACNISIFLCSVQGDASCLAGISPAVPAVVWGIHCRISQYMKDGNPSRQECEEDLDKRTKITNTPPYAAWRIVLERGITILAIDVFRIKGNLHISERESFKDDRNRYDAVFARRALLELLTLENIYHTVFYSLMRKFLVNFVSLTLLYCIKTLKLFWYSNN